MIVMFLLTALGCKGPQNPSSDVRVTRTPDTLSYAKGFLIEAHDGYKILSVFNPWQNSKDVKFQYILGKDYSMVPENLSTLPFIKVPVKRVVTLSTTHIAFIDTLTGVNSIIGISGSRYACNADIRQRIDNHELKDVGYDQNLNYEIIVDLKPDVVFMFGVEGSVSGTISKLEDLGLVPVMCGDYLEAHPLGKVEWIKFFGEFYGHREKAAAIFSEIDNSYTSVIKKSSTLIDRPAVLTGLPWKNTWYLPGGNSFAAKLIHDAGGNYLWSDNHSEESLPMDLESVYLKALEADIWINPGDASSLDALLVSEERFSNLPVFREGNIYNNNLRLNLYGGNDYWESGALRPDLVVADLFAIFHPEKVSGHHFTYYKKLK